MFYKYYIPQNNSALSKQLVIIPIKSAIIKLRACSAFTEIMKAVRKIYLIILCCFQLADFAQCIFFLQVFLMSITLILQNHVVQYREQDFNTCITASSKFRIVSTEKNICWLTWHCAWSRLQHVYSREYDGDHILPPSKCWCLPCVRFNDILFVMIYFLFKLWVW